MSDRQEIEGRFLVEGLPVLFKLINNPTIDDVVVSEARRQATIIESGPLDDDAEHRVPRDIRDFLIRLGVDK